jgi:O-antigen ligase
MLQEGLKRVNLQEGKMWLKTRLMLSNKPIFGVGGKGAEIREDETGVKVLSHDEITRMLAEHGTLGILGLLILFFTPLVLYLENKFNMFCLCCFLF